MTGDRKAFLAMPSVHPANLFVDTASHDAMMRSAYEVGKKMRDPQKLVADAAEYSMRSASWSVAAIIQRIEEFQQSLNDTQEVALYIIGGPSGMNFFPTAISPIDTDKVVFQGLDSDGRPFTVIQHLSQLNFAIQAVSVAPAETPRRMGFHHPDDYPEAP